MRSSAFTVGRVVAKDRSMSDCKEKCRQVRGAGLRAQLSLSPTESRVEEGWEEPCL